MSQPFKPALLIIDLQEDFLPPNGSLAVKDGRSIIPKIIELMKSHQWAAVVTTKDWHPQDHTSFASNHLGKKAFETIDLPHPEGKSNSETGSIATKPQILWPDHCVQGTKGSEFAEEFLAEYQSFVEKLEIPTLLVKKGFLVDREYYSCFQDVWGIHKTECGSTLSDLGITHTFIVGVAYDVCVMNSAIDSAALGFNTYVIKDCAKSVYPENDDTTESSLIAKNVRVISSDNEILSSF